MAEPPSTVTAAVAASSQLLSASDLPPATDSAPASRTRLSASDPYCSTTKPPVPQLGAAASSSSPLTTTTCPAWIARSVRTFWLSVIVTMYVPDAPEFTDAKNAAKTVPMKPPREACHEGREVERVQPPRTLDGG